LNVFSQNRGLIFWLFGSNDVRDSVNVIIFGSLSHTDVMLYPIAQSVIAALMIQTIFFLLQILKAGAFEMDKLNNMHRDL